MEITENYFVWGGKRFWFPRPENDMNGRPRALGRTTALEFCEATDLCMAGMKTYGPLIVAVLCRPAGEQYRERAALRRAAEMRTLPAEVIGKVSGMLAEAHAYMKEQFPACYAGGGSKLRSLEPKEPERGRQMAWGEFLLAVAGYKPTEVKAAERMNCYDFMRLADCCIRSGRTGRLSF